MTTLCCVMCGLCSTDDNVAANSLTHKPGSTVIHPTSEHDLSRCYISISKGKTEFPSAVTPALRQWICEGKRNHGKLVNYMGISE